MAVGSRFDEDAENEQLNKSSCTRIPDSSSSNKQLSVGKVPYYKLFSFADIADYVLMVIGAVAAIGSGLCLPLMTLLFGELANSFGHKVETNRVVEEVSKVSLKFLYLALGSGIAAFSQVTCWMITSERQAVRIRNLYLRAVLRQDVGYFDTETNTGEIIERMSTDIITIQDATGEKVASFTGEKRAVDKYEKSLDRAYEAGVEEGLAAGLGSGIFMLILFCSYALGIWFGAKMILDKGYTGGDVLNIVMAVVTGSFSLGQVSPCLSAFAAGQVAAFKIFQTINRKPDIDPYNVNGKVPNDINGDLELRDVCFSYPSRPDEKIFDGFSLVVASGTTLALVGESGSGKSTVINLVERFYDPQKGAILIDGVDIKEFRLSWIRGKIGLVSQEPVLFALSIKENIAYGKNGATLDEIRAAAEHANAANFIDKLPQGMDTMVGVNGTQLSGGQKQRIALARAILKDPKILLLDEATSALDAESERTVQEALERIMIDRTTVIVAHRLSTIKNADSIAVIHRGKIVEKGSHSELTRNPRGVYSNLIQLQKLNKEYSAVTNSPSDEINVDYELRSVNREIAVHRKPKKERKVSLRRLAYLNKPELPELILGSLAAVINGAVLPLYGLLFSRTIKTFYEPPHELLEHSKFWACMLIFLGVGSLLATPIKTYFFAVAGCKLIKRIRLMCFDKVVHMDISWFDRIENSGGVVGSRLSTDATSVRNLIGESLAMLVQNVSTAVVGLIVGFGASWELSLIVMAMMPLIGLNGYLHMKFISGFNADTKKLFEEATQVASEAVGSIRTVASFSAEEKVMKLHLKKCEVPVRLGTKHGLISGACFGISLFFLYSVYAASYYAGARLVDAGRIQFGDVFRVFLGLSMTAVAISQSSALAPDSDKAKASVASIFKILDEKSEIDSADNSGITLENIKGDIVFQHVSFKYPNRADVQIFKDLCLAIHSGKTVAIVGESGSGKSTMVSLLQRFYDPDCGEITIDGIGIKMLNLKWLRQKIGVVSQEPVLFNDTIRANIAYGKEGGATEAEIVAAAELANAHKFICGTHKGYETVVGERGIQLSGGQKQRVAIARAIVKCPKILLLDEATSALDAESEKAVQDALDRAAADRTTVVVAHRLSTIKNADLIAVLRNGVVAEKGKHESLINKKDGLYAYLVGLQNNGI